MSVHLRKLSEIAELKWDGAIKLIIREVPEREQF